MSSQNPQRPSPMDDLPRDLTRPTPGGGDVPPYDTTTRDTGAPTGMTTGASRDYDTLTTSDTGPGMKERVGGAASTARDKASEFAGTATEKVDQQRDTVAGRMDTVASTLRGKAEQIPGGERTTDIAQTAATKIEGTADYLRQHEVSDMMTDLEEMVRKHPTESLIAAAAAGFLLGRMLRS